MEPNTIPFQPRPDLEFEDTANWRERIEDSVIWLTEGGIPTEYVTLVTGPGDTGKSLFGLTLSLSVLTGRTLLPSFPVEPHEGNFRPQVLLLAGEDSASIILSRIATIAATYGIDDAELNDAVQRLLIVSDSGEFIERGQDGCWQPTYFLRQIQKQLNHCTRKGKQFFRVTLVIVDPLRRYLGSVSENDNSSAGALMAELSDTIRNSQSLASMVLLHHVSKRDSKARGASAFRDESRCAFTMEPAEGDGVLLVHDKQNYGPKLAPVRLAFKGAALTEVDVNAPELVEGIAAWLADSDKLLTIGGVKQNRGQAVNALLAHLSESHPGVNRADVLSAIQGAVKAGVLVEVESVAKNGKPARVLAAGVSK